MEKQMARKSLPDTEAVIRARERKRKAAATFRATRREDLRSRARDYYKNHMEERRVYGRQWSKNRLGKYPVEAKAEQYLADGVRMVGGMCPKFNDPGRRGAPDRIVCLPGHPAYFVELKRSKLGKLDAHQQRYHDDLRAAGQRVWVLWSKEDVDGFFAEI